MRVISLMLQRHKIWQYTCDVHRQRNEKALRGDEKHRAGCNKAEPKNFAPPQTPFPVARDGQNLISWRWSLPLPTNPAWWGSMHAILSYRGITDPQTQPHTHRQDRLQYTAPQLARSVIRWLYCPTFSVHSYIYHVSLGRQTSGVHATRSCLMTSIVVLPHWTECASSVRQRHPRLSIIYLGYTANKQFRRPLKRILTLLHNPVLALAIHATSH